MNREKNIMKAIRELIKEKRVYFDGGTGTVLQKKGLKSGESPEMWNITQPHKIVNGLRRMRPARPASQPLSWRTRE